MTIYPAIDLRNGKCVRLFQGKADAETVYFENPLDPALHWKEQGAEFLHVVDLDGAFTGGSQNLDAVEQIIRLSGLQVQLGGGMRDEATIANALELGLCRVIIGTRACNEPEWIESLISKFGSDRIVVGIDAKDGMVATKGWVEKTKVDALDLAKKLYAFGLRWIIHTDVATDGAMLGPNLEAQKKMLEAVPDCSVIASGGVSRKEDLGDLNNLASEYSNLEGVIIGKALYEKTINLCDCFA
ncbi:MAG: 1-(5-phosphoribosyl)-5-[(5-phosphoribosylamino)methylideneamino]imidazole-4-carboxamide isomerase [Verrucomicrobiota bacterium]|nr:1-(5-phosphoribosyl)-5-[(5-phosphoribosylamino)methylideneamino]imidazole-4-carboxamide isomerase [Verrucomicrobiota bacterium]